MMQEIFDDENHRSLNYTKIDRCQDNISIDNDEYYRQIFSSNEYLLPKQKILFQINFINHLSLFLFIILFLTSQANALPIYVQQTQTSGLPVAMVELTDRSVYSPPPTFHVYRRFPNPIQQVNRLPNYPNSAAVQVYDQQQVNRMPKYPNNDVVQVYDKQQVSTNVQNQQLRRERQRRAMIDKMVTIFDEDGIDLYISIQFNNHFILFV